MEITFLGAAETVTGSKFLVRTQDATILVDCGLYQGYKRLRDRNRQPLPVAVGDLDAILLTHAHLDHSGYIPVLYKQGYRGPVYTHEATKTLCSVLLADSGHLQEEDARYYRRHSLGKHKNPEPLYTRNDAIQSLSLFKTLEFNESFTVGDITFQLQPAGHILGAASIILEANGKRIGFSGDVGQSSDLFMCPPVALPEVDVLLLESTYGNRRHEQNDPFSQLESIINATAESGGVVLVPSFAVGRAQLLMHLIAELQKQQRIPKMPVFLDSPMAINVSDIYCRYSEFHRLTHQQCQELCNVATYTRSVEESKALAQIRYPHIIIAGSGMVTGGRILHHLKRLLPDHRTTVVFSGYQAGGTRGEKLISGVDHIKIHGQWIPNNARTAVLSGLSGHGDYEDLEHWLTHSSLHSDTQIELVHGDPQALEQMRDHLKKTTTFNVNIAEYMQTLTL